MGAMKVNLHIDRLVLEGFSRAEGRTVGAALERELARLIDRGGLPAHLHSATPIPRLDSGSLNLSPQTRPGTVGRQLARQIYGGTQK
jgi:hypothetical protein